MAGSMSKDKGQRGEREIAVMFVQAMEAIERETGCAGYSVEVKRNTLQSDRGGYDLVGIPLLAIEVKRAETLAVNQWWKQTLDQCRPGLLPVLFYRPNRKPWQVQTFAAVNGPNGVFGGYVVATMTATEFMLCYKALYRALILAEKEQ